eukprot:CAMPEP_0169159010 /NCGR_PEP_ID=MMETSP1015-20121227/55519_1 /TAXON_ID=342587 /ORGANISM="Karlodinium micrum, Strain CCMP2283" /LENGTH=97 /DNA_ID=CAMNT_0009230243 /DNA_START=1438 /DNA_END=1731 /DNA_ORIENTATION=+
MIASACEKHSDRISEVPSLHVRRVCAALSNTAGSTGGADIEDAAATVLRTGGNARVTSRIHTKSTNRYETPDKPKLLNTSADAARQLFVYAMMLNTL